MAKICPFFQKECIEEKCMAWDDQCLLINKGFIPSVHKSELPMELIDIDHGTLVKKLQKLAKKKKSELEYSSLDEIYLTSLNFYDVLSEELQNKLDKAVDEVTSDLLKLMYPDYFITGGAEEIAERMFKWIINNIKELTNIWEGQQKFLEKHNIDENKLSFNSEIYRKYNKSVQILWDKLTIHEEEENKKRLTELENELFEKIDQMIQWVRDLGYEKMSKNNLKLFLSENNYKVPPVIRQKLYNEINLRMK